MRRLRSWSQSKTVIATTYDEANNLWVTDLANGEKIRSRYFVSASGLLVETRQNRLLAEMEAALLAGVWHRVRSSVSVSTWESLTNQVVTREIDPWSAAERVLTALPDD